MFLKIIFNYIQRERERERENLRDWPRTRGIEKGTIEIEVIRVRELNREGATYKTLPITMVASHPERSERERWQWQCRTRGGRS
jgi:hypothetical protein